MLLSFQIILSALLCVNGFYLAFTAGKDFLRGSDSKASLAKIALGFCTAAGGLCVFIALVVTE